MVLIKRSGIYIPKGHVEFEGIKAELTRKIFNYGGTTSKIDLFMRDMNPNIIIDEDTNIDEHTMGITIPRLFPVCDDINILTDKGYNIDINSTIVLKERQQKYANIIDKIDNCVIKAETGVGKTVMCIHHIAKFKKKSLIIVNKSSLARNWKKEFLIHTDLSDDDISFLDTKDLTKFDKPILVSTVQCLLIGLKNEKFVDKLKNSGIGMTFFDECHTVIGPEQFSKVSLTITSRKVYGVSATPIRHDLKDVMELHLGETVYVPLEAHDQNIKPIVYMIYFPFGVWSAYNNPRFYLMSYNVFQYARYDRGLIKSESFFNTVSELIRKAYLSGNKKILVLGKNLKPIFKLIEKCKFKKESVGIFLPTSKVKERLLHSDEKNLDKAFYEKDVVFATYKAGRDGNNRKDFDCLFMTSMTSNPEQAIGRILRDNDGKEKHPIVFDLVDLEVPSIENKGNESGVFVKSSEKREFFYKQKGWEVKKIKLKYKG